MARSLFGVDGWIGLIGLSIDIFDSLLFISFRLGLIILSSMEGSFCDHLPVQELLLLLHEGLGVLGFGLGRLVVVWGLLIHSWFGAL